MSLNPYLWKYLKTRLSALAKIDGIKYEHTLLYKEILLTTEQCTFLDLNM